MPHVSIKAPYWTRPALLDANRTFQVVLEPLPLQLDPVTVEGTPQLTRRRLAEFQLRRESGGGSYIVRDEFLRMGTPHKPTDVLRRMRGVRVERNLAAMSDRGGSLRNWQTNQWVVTVGHSSSRMGRPCFPLYFLDGRYIGNSERVDVDQVLSVNEIEGVEAYGSGATIPVELNRTGSACGVIAFWTR